MQLITTYHSLFVGGGGMFSARVPLTVNTSTDKIIGRLENLSAALLTMPVSAAFFTHLDFASRSITLKILRFGPFLVERPKCFFIGVLGALSVVFSGRTSVSKPLSDSSSLELCF